MTNFFDRSLHNEFREIFHRDDTHIHMHHHHAGGAGGITSARGAHIERRSTMPRPQLLRYTPRPPVRRHHTLGSSLLSSSSSSTPTGSEDEDFLVKAGF